jgi:hypothetical protein
VTIAKKMYKGKKIDVHSLIHAIKKEGCARALGWGLEQNDKFMNT